MSELSKVARPTIDRRRFLWLGAGALTAPAILAACGGSSKSSSSSTGASSSSSATATGTPSNYDPNAIMQFGVMQGESYDPIRAVAVEYFQLDAIFDTLVAYDAKGNFLPRLATSWDIMSDRVRLHLRSGVTFHDGTPFNADAVKFTLNRALTDAASTVKSVLFMLGAVNVVDEMTVDCMMTQNAPQPLLYQLADRPGMIVSPTAVGKVNGNSVAFSNAPVGAGMYKINGAWYPREKMSVRAYEGYWDKPSQTLAGIDFTNVLEAAEVNALRAGSADMASGLIAADYNSLKGTSILTKIAPAPNFIYGLNMNITIKPLDNPLVRQAIGCAIDRVAVNNALAQGLGTPCYQVAPPNTPWYDPTLDSINKYDPARAKQLLSQAGYPNGVTVPSIIGATAAIYVQFGELIQSQLKQAGINLDLQLVNQALTIPMLYRDGGHGTAASSTIGGGMGIVGNDNILRNALLPAGATNAGGVNVPGVQALLDSAAQASSQSDVVTAYKAVNKIVTQGAYWFIPVYAAPFITGYANYCGGPITAESGGNPLTTQFFRGFYITKGKVKA